METLLLRGNPVRDAVFADLKARVQTAARAPGLAVLLVGDDPASAVYVRHKENGCREVGFHQVTHRMPASTPENEILALIAELNADAAIDGILVQLPLPAGLDAEKILLAVHPAKDVDGLHPENLGRLVSGHPRLVSCTPRGILKLLNHYEIPLSGKRVAVVGRSVIVGRSLSLLLSLKNEGKNATVTMCHSGTRDLAAETSRAEVVIAAMGSPRALGRDHVAPGAVVVDVGINRIPAPETAKGTRLVGDVDFDALLGHASALTPVPGGVGPMTIAMLLENTFDAMVGAEGHF